MKNKLFNLGVFKEAFSQLKIVGFISVAIYLVAGMLTPIGYIVELIEDSYNQNVSAVHFSEGYFFILFGLMYVFVPVMMLVVFFWLTRRHSCDFYHALPIKRESIYFNSILAVLAWVGIIFVAATVIPLIVIGMIPKLYIDMVDFWKIIVYIFAGCIQMIGVFALGIMLTGHGFTNIVASCMILIVPRALITGIVAMVDEFMPFAEINIENTFINPFYNIGFGSFYSIISWMDSEVFGILIPVIYSTILGLIYMGVAGFLFKIRKSESASSASTYGFVQSIFRMIPSYVFALVGLYFILETFYEYDFEIGYYFFALVFLTMALLAYFIYELITTRRWRSVGRSAKQLPILAGAVILTGIIIVVSTNAATMRKIDADKIKFIETELTEGMSELASTNVVMIKDEKLNEIIEEAYKEQVEKYYNHENYYDDRSIRIGINQGGKTFYRRVFITESEKEYFDEAYTKALKESDIRIVLPDVDEIDEMYLANYGERLTEKQVKTLYVMLAEELKNVKYGDLVSVPEEEIIDSINIYPNYYYSQIPISSLTPDTKEMLIMMYKENVGVNNNSDFKKMLNKINQLYKDYVLDVDLDIMILSGEEIILHDMHVMYLNGKDQTNVIEILKRTDKNEGENVIYIQGRVNIYDEYDMYESYSFDSKYLIDDELMKEYDKICGEYK